MKRKKYLQGTSEYYKQYLNYIVNLNSLLAFLREI